MKKRHKPINPARTMAAGFMGLIFFGSLLLNLPIASKTAEISYIDALFTAASAVCVTGLVVVDTGTFFTSFGQSVIMLLIFCGSLGFMTMTTLVFVFLGRKITLRDRVIVKDALNQESFSGLITLVKSVIYIAVSFILLGTVVLGARLIPDMGFKKGLFYALFHAISAFGNAGFDLFGNYDSLTRFPTDYLVTGTIMFLFIIGGLGFTVIIDLVRRLRYHTRLSLHSRLVLIITAMLLSLGTVLVFILEFNNPYSMGELSGGAKIFTAIFTAATPRTAGFSVLETSSLNYPTLVILIALMFIGASPTSTGGGVKTTTFGIVLFSVVNMIRGRYEPVCFKRRLSVFQFIKAVSIMVGAIALIFTATLLISIFETKEFIDIFFEVFSAFGTVGLSRGITTDLSSASKLVLIFTMFGGRIGPLTLLVALARQQKEDHFRYPEEKLLIG